MATTGGSNFVLNIVELQNTVTSASGLTPISVLQTAVGQIQEMVIFGEKRIAVNTISRYNEIPIQVVDPINIGPTGGFSIGGTVIYGGGSLGPTGQTGPTGTTTRTAIHQAAGTIVMMNTIKAYMSSAGALWLGSNTGTALNLYGQGTWTYFGGVSGSSISLVGLNAFASATSTPGTGRQGDLVVAVVTDTTNNATYRVTGQQTGVSVTGNYSIIIEQLG